MRISDWSSDVCSSDLGELFCQAHRTFIRLIDRAADGVGDGFAGDLHRQRLGLQPRAVADLARGGRLVFAKLLAHPRAVGGEHPAFEVADDAFERLYDLIGFAPVLEAEREDRKSTRLNSS